MYRHCGATGKQNSNHTKGGKVPSTNKLASHKSSRTTRHHVRGSVAKFLLSFCGLASFGVVTKLVALGTAFLVLFAIPVSITLLNTNNTYATGSGNSNTITANLPGSVAIRLLDSTSTTEISSLDFNNLTPTPQGTTASKSFIVDVATSNPTGYKLYMQSDYQTKDSSGNPTGNYTTNLTHTDADVTDNIPTLVPGSGSSADTKVYWNYVNPLTSTTSPIPAYGQPDKIGQYFTPTVSNQSTIDINVGIDTTIVSGAYENQLLFSAVGNPTTLSYSVSFDTDGGTMTGEDIEEISAAGTHSITIPATSEYTPTKTGYQFNHWQIVIPQGSSVDAACNNTNICSPGDNIVIHSGVDSQGDFEGAVELKAIYEKTGIVTISTMQEMTSDLCATSIEGDTVTLTDVRDNNTYTVKKLKDGNCWMTQNLNYLPTSGTVLTSDNSNVSASVTLSSITTDCSQANISNFCIVSAGRDDLDYGTYYNWYAATASSGTSSMVAPDVAPYSICPKGWRLPTSGPSGEYQTLYNNYKTDDPAETWAAMTDTTGPQFVLGGRAEPGSSPVQQGIYGRYWSSSASTNTIVYSLSLRGTDSTIYPANGDYSMWFGLTLRCLANESIHQLTVDPAGGTWEGSTEEQTFTGESGSTKEISNPTKPADTAYTISYDGNSQGATFTSYPTSTTETFTGWSLSGSGSFDNNTYTFGDGSATLTAQYSNNLRSFTLPNIVKPDYTCKWAEGSPTGTQYPGGTFRTISGNTTYYAVCTTANITTISTMQEMTTAICSNTTIGDDNTLRDTRDNNTYTVRKLKDGNCWMTQNLRLTGRDTNFTQDDSDVSPSGFSMPTSAENTETWCITDDAVCDDQAQYLNSNNMDYGVYYNWYTATAGSGTYGMESTNASYSICPKGWQLPTGDDNGSFQTIRNIYDDYNSLSDPSGPYYILSGRRIGDETKYQEEVGRWWSSTASSNNRGLNLDIWLYDSTVSTSGKNNGLSVRCLAQNPTYTLTIDPNGGTLKGSTDVQSYSGTTGETRTVSNPIGPAAYTISYDDNGQGATYTESPSSATKSFSSWALSGTGSFAGGSYEFGSGNGMLTAQYNTESDMFILPFISKSGYSCQWAEGSPSGTLHTGGSGYTTVSGNTTFYAVCTNNTFNSISNMQDMTPTICANASTGDAATLTDTRDNKTYTIRKLADGNCWMTQNLALTGRDTNFTQDDSDVSPSGFSMPTSAEDAGTWCRDYDAACIDQTKYLDSGDNSRGTYYNWYTATASSGSYSTRSASYSICPKGWRLPTGGPIGELQTLYANDSYNTPDKMFASDGPAFILSGRRLGGARDQDVYGFYWSSSAYKDDDGYILRLGLLDVHPVIAYAKHNGFSARCIAKGYDVDISNSNTTTSADKLNIPYGGSKTVTVTPNSGYYLSSVTCPTGYTCSGYNTGASATGTQTVTITNDNSTSGGTLTFTGTLAAPTSCATAQPVEPGSAPGTMNMYTHSSGTKYVKLYTNSAKTSSACFTKSSVGASTWTSSYSGCSSAGGSGPPSQAQFSNLISAYGSGGNLNKATGWSGSYWSSAYNVYYLYYVLSVSSSSASVSGTNYNYSYQILCVASSQFATQFSLLENQKE